jgi:hypothetical protein
MNKSNRYSLIQNLIVKGAAGRMETSRSEIEEEKKLVLTPENDDSILDDEEKNLYASPALVAIGKLDREEKENLFLSKAESDALARDMKRPVSFFKVKKREEAEEELTPLDKMDINGLLSFSQYN